MGRGCRNVSKHMKPQSIMEPQSQTCENGPEKGELTLKKPLGAITSTLSQPKKTLSQHQTSQTGTPTLYIPECPLKNSEKTSEDNLDSSNPNIQPICSLKTLGLESTTNAMDSEPFWNNCSKEMSKKLWLPTLIDSQDSDTISLNGCSHTLEQYWSLWRNLTPIEETNLLKTSWKFSQSFQPVTMDKENTIITRKIKIHPTRGQKILFNKCFNIHRYFYNKAISKINELYTNRKNEFEASETCLHCSEAKVDASYCCEKHGKKALPWKLNISLISLRKAILKSDKELKGTNEEWQCDVPYDTRQLAIKDAVSAYRSAVQNKVRGHIQSFTLGYKSRRSPSKLFWIDSNAIKIKNSRIHLFPARLGKDCAIRIRKRQRKKLPPTFNHDCKIMKYGKHYYLVYSTDKPIRNLEITREPIVSLDPGIRSFQTGYSPSGMTFKVGEQQIKILKKLHKRLDALRSNRDKATSNKRQRLRTRCLDVELGIKNTVANLHNLTGSFLTKQYDTILLPEFGTSVMQQGKELRSSTKRNMWSLSHYKFQEKLKGMCNRTGTKLYIVQEHFTTKTCGQCGILQNVGSSEVYTCSQCSYHMDRDIHGARNILLKHITQHGI